MKYGVKSKAAIISKKYAQAFINVFLDALSLQDYHNMQKAAANINERLLFFLQLSALDYEVKKNALHILSTRFALPAPVQKLFHVLLQDNRLFLICGVLRYVCLLYRQCKHIEEFVIMSSHPLSKNGVSIIEQFLERMTKRDVMCTYKQDKKLIAGIKLQSDTLLWEYSICQRLNKATLSLHQVEEM